MSTADPSIPSLPNSLAKPKDQLDLLQLAQSPTNALTPPRLWPSWQIATDLGQQQAESQRTATLQKASHPSAGFLALHKPSSTPKQKPQP
jgi:hypothetical protein